MLENFIEVVAVDEYELAVLELGQRLQRVAGKVAQYADDEGQLLAGSFMDYLLPTSTDIPAFDVAVLDLAPSPLNPLGVKGAGEVGIVATGAALSNAVSNA